MNGSHARAAGTTGDGSFQRIEPRLFAARGQLDIPLMRVPHPTRHAKLRGRFTHEPSEAHPLHLPGNPEVDDGHA